MSAPTSHASGERSSDVQALEHLLLEFFAPTTDHSRQAQIDGVLQQFVDQKDSWRHALLFLAQSDQPYVLMYALNCLQTWIHSRWLALSGLEHAQVRQELYARLVPEPAPPGFVRKKVMRLLVDVARSDWPHFYPEFMPQLTALVARPPTRILGLEMLLIASEELATPREDLPSARKLELRKLLEQHVGQLIDSLVDILGRTHLGPTPGQPSRPDSLDPADSRLVAGLALSCLTHLFTWIPIQTQLKPHILDLLFRFCSWQLNEDNLDQLTLNSQALSAVNEILYRNCIPHDAEESLLILFQSSFALLQQIVLGCEPDGPSLVHRLGRMDVNFLDKIIEFIRTFMASHFQRFESNARVPIVEFMSLVFRLTFAVPTPEAYLRCLEIWEILVAYISKALAARQEEGGLLVKRYEEALLSLVGEIINKAQFQKSHQFLDQLQSDTSFLHQDNEEWRGFLSTSLEMIMKVSDILSTGVLKRVYWIWQESAQSYLSLADHTEGLFSQMQEDQTRLQYFLKDFSTLLTLMGRLSSLFIGELFHERLHEGHEMTKELIHLSTFNSRHKFYTLSLPDHLKREFLQIQAETMASLKAWCHWLGQLHASALKNPSHESLCKELTSGMVITVGPVIRQRDSPVLVHSAAHFLVTLTGTVRPPSIWKLKEFTDLYSSVTQLDVEADAKRLIIRALANVLLLPWPGLPEQRWDERQKHLSKFLRSVNAPFLRLNASVDLVANVQVQAQAESVVLSTLEVVQDLVESVLSETTQSKRLCYDCIKEYVETSLQLFPVYITNTRVCKGLFSFFHIIFDVLKAQMGVNAVEQAVQSILTTFDRNQLKDVIMNEASGGLHVAESFLALLQFIVKEPSASFRKFVTSALDLVLNDIYPLVADRPTADIKGSIFCLLHNILLYNWRYFFKPSVVKSLVLTDAGTPTPAAAEDDVQHRAEFMAILQAYGQSFLQPDVTLFQQNLSTLEEVNSRWKLYHKHIFVKHLTVQFLTVFFQVLARGTHNLLKEEITLCIFHMASVDYYAFFKEFLPYFLDQDAELDSNQKQILHSSFKPDQDLPTFIVNSDRFVNDLKYYKICNASLKMDSVAFK